MWTAPGKKSRYNGPMKKVFSFSNLLLLIVILCAIAYYKFVLLSQNARAPQELQRGPSMNYTLPPVNEQ